MSDYWQVHIWGPDDLLPATGMLDAMKQANEINVNMLAHLTERGVSEYTPRVWAIPVPPGVDA